MSAASGVVDRLRRPEYTGENRCVPCTATNLVIAVVAAVAVPLVLPGALATVAGAGVLLVSVAAIYLRGYLVPGTPWFTRTYFPDRLLAAFDKHPAPPTTADGDVDVEAALVAAGALSECADVDDLCLTPGFRAAWRERIDALDGEDATRAELAAILGTDADRLSFSEFGSAFVAQDGDRGIGQWESRAAFVADVAAGQELGERGGPWPDLDVAQRGALLSGLRLFIERCPDCGGPVELSGEETRSCCRSFEVAAATCAHCEARLFEARLPRET